MLKHLSIRHIILIESAEIQFEPGLNVLSGETGSGKSAIMDALALILGTRADTSLIRKGADKASVEAIFDIDHLPALSHLLEEAGIEHEKDDNLIIRREISQQGKSRAFINHQAVQQSLLKKVGEHLIDMIGQHATHELFSTETHRSLLDLFGKLEPALANFRENWQKENSLRQKIDQLIASEANRIREIEICLHELEELQTANLKSGEDETLFAEYTLLANSEERLAKSQAVYTGLCAKRDALLPQLNQYVLLLEGLAKIDPQLEEIHQTCHHARIELQEVAYTLQAYLNKIDASPERLHQINERLTLINRLKRKYGSSIEEIHQYSVESKKKLHDLENISETIQDLQDALVEISTKNSQLCLELTHQRKEAANTLTKAMQKELRSLNMPKVEFSIKIAAQPRNASGDDHIEFFLCPNIGEKEIAIRECASGGELSRLMLAFQTLLAGCNKIPTLVFDEIDANIGGETAAIIGEKLKSIGEKHQVLCITHFPQVAQYALIHWQISKEEKKGRTYTVIERLDAKGRDEELARMAGKTYAKAYATV